MSLIHGEVDSVCDMAVRTVLISRHFDVLGAFNEEVGLYPSD